MKTFIIPNRTDIAVTTHDPHNYTLTHYKVEPDGLKDSGDRLELKLVRGSKTGENNPQTGVTTEQLLWVALNYLTEVNQGHFRCRDNSLAITYIENALLRLQKRSNDRLQRNVLNTYEK